MRTVGDRFPSYDLAAVLPSPDGGTLGRVRDTDHPGRWRVVFFWPKDFTFVCPTEIAEFGRRERDFRARDAQLLGVSTDQEYAHLAWRRSHPDLRDLPYPMLADTKRELSSALGILHPVEGVPLRATFIVDPDGIIRHVTVNDLDVGRSVEETLRVLDALQTGELCPCNWKQGQPTLQPS
ncbi:MAG: peroxiredoxin [Myxococcota bacterium]|nr:peroxiredoxin [Myxococcota bacterium]MDW8363747.1 peroxiredoxin [Myxococcales bacterium]